MYACIYIPNASGDTAAALLDCASAFSPRIENTAAGTVVFDADGLERLFGGYAEIAEKVLEQVRERGLQGNVAIASNAGAAICAARGFAGITVLNRGTEAARLSHLPLAVLEPAPEVLETLERWGIRTLGSFAKLPPVQVAERLGQPGVKLHNLARGAGSRPIVSHTDPARFVEVVELDYDITTIEPLTFILSRMLEGICARLRSRNLATHELRLTLGTYLRVLNLPLPVRNSRLLTKLLILDLEAHPPGIAISRVEIEAVPAKPRVVQNGLFVPLSPEPEKLELTLARLKAVVGEENVGSPEILDTHRPDAFQIKRFGVAGERQNIRYGIAAERQNNSSHGRQPVENDLSNDPSPAGTTQSQYRPYGAGSLPEPTTHGLTPVAKIVPPLRGEATTQAASLRGDVTTQTASLRGDATTRTPPLRDDANPHLPPLRGSSLALRLLRPALEATVQLRNSIPIRIGFHGAHGSIAAASGPWHTSGDWWRPNTWDREEWDIEAGDALYRIYYDVHLDRWYVYGVYD